MQRFPKKSLKKMQVSFLIFLFQVLIIQSEILLFPQNFKLENTIPEFKK